MSNATEQTVKTASKVQSSILKTEVVDTVVQTFCNFVYYHYLFIVLSIVLFLY